MVRIEYEQDGIKMEEEIYCVVETATFEMFIGDSALWMADYLFSFKAEKGMLDLQYKLFQTMMYSFRVNPEWFNKYVQLIDYLVRNELQAIQSWAQLSQIISQTADDIDSIVWQSYNNRNAASDRIAENFSNYIRGTDTYYNPILDSTVKLPSGASSVWANALGEYILSDDVNYDANVGSTQNWQLLDLFSTSNLLSASQRLDPSANATLTVAPETGYRIDSFRDGGGSPDGATDNTGAIAGAGAVSASLYVSLPAPQNLQAMAGNGAVLLQWKDVDGVDGYTLYRATRKGIQPANFDIWVSRHDGVMIEDATSPHTVEGLDNGTEYFFVVTASRGRMEGLASEEVVATPEAGPLLIAERYLLSASGAATVVDVTTALEWQRCALGQTWDGATCSGSAGAYSHAEAQQAAAAFNRSRSLEEPEWRVPEVQELQTLVYCASRTPARFLDGTDTGCWGSHGTPTLEPTVFPSGSAVGGWFWSASTHTDGYAWGLDFDRGTVHPYHASAFSGVRLMRSAASDLE